MSQEQQSFKESRIYPILFMMVITVFFVGMLAIFYHSTKDRVKQYEVNTFHKAVLDAFNLPDDNVELNYKKYIKELSNNKITYFKAVNDTTTLGYAFFINGKGLWGGIQSIISLTPDYKRIINLTITTQNETPGLGARITEPWFTDQFKNKDIFINNQIVKYKLVAENSTNINNLEVKQITGATLSSKSVTDMIYNEVQKIIKDLKVTK